MPTSHAFLTFLYTVPCSSLTLLLFLSPSGARGILLFKGKQLFKSWAWVESDILRRRNDSATSVVWITLISTKCRGAAAAINYLCVTWWHFSLAETSLRKLRKSPPPTPVSFIVWLCRPYAKKRKTLETGSQTVLCLEVWGFWSQTKARLGGHKAHLAGRTGWQCL